MIIDAQTRFSSAQVVTTGTQLSTNSYDIGAARDLASGQRLKVYVTVNAPFTGGSSLQVNIVESPNTDLSSPTVLYSAPPVAEGGLTAGKVLVEAALPKTSKRYIGLQYVSVGTHTAGAVDGGILFDADSNTVYPAIVGF